MQRFTTYGAAFAGIGVLLGAFAAHALRDRVPADLLAIFETGVRYQLVHGLALLALGAPSLPVGPRARRFAGATFAAGIVLFSGSLYALALSGVRALGGITPLGGIAFLAGWATIAVDSARRRG